METNALAGSRFLAIDRAIEPASESHSGS